MGMGNDVYPVSAVAFDTIERVVGHLPQELRTQGIFGGADRRPDAHGNGERATWRVKGHVANGGPETFGTFSQRLKIAIRHHNQELFTSGATYMIVAACSFAESLCSFSKDGVSNLMPIGIIDPLEMVEVSDQHSHRLAVSLSP